MNTIEALLIGYRATARKCMKYTYESGNVAGETLEIKTMKTKTS